jgi:twinkle protein
MRWCQVIIGFERNKQADGDGKHESKIRLLKHRKFGTTGELNTKYEVDTGRLVQYTPEESDDSEEF